MGQNRNNSREDVTRIRDIFEQLDQCVEEAEQAKRTGNWDAAYEAKHNLDKQIDAFEVVESLRLGTQVAVAIKSFLDSNWVGFLAALATMTAIIVAYRKRHNPPEDSPRSQE